MKVKYMLPLLAFIVLSGCCWNLVGKSFSKCGCPLCGYGAGKTTLSNENTLYKYEKRCDDKINYQKTTVEVSPNDTIVNVNHLSTCPNYFDVQGKNFDSYAQKYGVPINKYTLQNGNKLYSYRTLCEDKTNWLEYNIEVNQQNIIVKRQDVKVCPINAQF
ncbi:MAG: hypothetical protein J5594_03370 [Elusimicrobiaceae bacterium]|nr:hypothetical protein [Elusimicrobiaceae bacterium]